VCFKQHDKRGWPFNLYHEQTNEVKSTLRATMFARVVCLIARRACGSFFAIGPGGTPQKLLRFASQ
jgi:hypothetical protein